VLLFQGLEGYDDVRPGSTVVAEWTAGADDEPDEADIADFEIATGDYGFDVAREALAVDDVAADSAAITQDVLAGEREDAFADAVALNAALRRYADEAVDSLEAGLAEARDVLAGGAAADRLEALRQF
jgi:anthranilate phosphoribosyltransferase